MSTVAQIDTPLTANHFDVLIIGAGISGIGAAYHLTVRRPGRPTRSSTAATRSAAPGTCSATRASARTPTCRPSASSSSRGRTSSRSPTLTSSSTTCARPSTEDGIDQHIRFGHHVESAPTCPPTPGAGRSGAAHATRRDRRADCPLPLLGHRLLRLRRGFTPDFDGPRTFAGQIIHPQHWPEDLDYAGKRVVVIGSGATAVTLVPAMAQAPGT